MAVISTASRPWSKFNRHGWSEFGRRQHCHAYQGYLFSKPLPIDALEHYLSAERLAA